MGHYLSTIELILRKAGRRKIELLSAYLKIICKANFYHKVQRYFYKPEVFTMNIMGVTIRFFNYPELLHLFEEIFVEEVYSFESSFPSPRIIDCGSHIGLSLIYFKKKFPLSTLVAFEPDENSFKLLRHNIEANQLTDVTAENCALGNRVGKRKFYSTSSAYGSVNNSFIEVHHNNAVIKNVVTLSEYIASDVALVKIDVEGAEGEIIHELCITGKIRLVNKLIFEYHPQCKIPVADLLGLLTKHGLVMSQIKSNLFMGIRPVSSRV